MTPPADPPPIRVLLVDDQPIVGQTVRQMLAAEPDVAFEFCTDPAAAIDMAEAFHPTVILQDLVMPDVDGLQLVKFIRAHPATRDVPLVVLSSKEEPVIKARAFALGANDYMVKLPDKLEVVARVRYHSRGYIALLERNEAYRKLAESQKELAAELRQAARYVRSLLPPKLTSGPVRIDWRFVPSTQLAGDMFGHQWLAPDHLAVFLLDVSGHGVGSALLAVSVGNLLMAKSLPDTDPRNPAAVIAKRVRKVAQGLESMITASERARNAETNARKRLNASALSRSERVSSVNSNRRSSPAMSSKFGPLLRLLRLRGTAMPPKSVRCNVAPLRTFRTENKVCPRSRMRLRSPGGRKYCVRLCCGSRSMKLIARLSARCAAANKLAASTVLPTPPLMLSMAMTLPRPPAAFTACRMRASVSAFTPRRMSMAPAVSSVALIQESAERSPVSTTTMGRPLFSAAATSRWIQLLS